MQSTTNKYNNIKHFKYCVDIKLDKLERPDIFLSEKERWFYTTHTLPIKSYIII